ncbi:hypothetical protein WKW79_27620 [Variovorax robiniae]|uniref:BioF2-like acetyltransferase domain-containing protein n=1 Tax=Variovorax robiniae TaxID=1836199 RepID=A0ABU8XI81_9BURK
MIAEGIKSVALEEASRYFERMPISVRPFSLHPCYVEADAVRTPRLQPIHLVYESQGDTWMHSFHRGQDPVSGFWDASSPYGYGGPLFTSSDSEFLNLAWAAYVQWMREQSVVVEYLRFHPMTGNDYCYPGKVTPNREVVWIDLEAGDWTGQYAHRLRYSLKKASKFALHVEETPLSVHVSRFGRFYRDAMAEMGASDFYFFTDRYFQLLASRPDAQLAVCRQGSEEDAPWLAACVLLRGSSISEYHLAGTTAEGRAVCASNFLLHACTRSANKSEQKIFYLGGGTDPSSENPLLFFKGSYSPLRRTYKTGTQLFDAARYAQLRELYPDAIKAHPERPIFYRMV